MSTLYELGQGFLELLALAEEGECDPQMIADTLESIDAEIEDKVDGCAKVMKQLDAECEAIDKELERLTARKKAMANNSDRIKKRVEEIMILTERPKIKTTLFTFSIQKNPASVKLETEDISMFPARFLKMHEPTIDKTAIKEALKAGEELPGIAHLEQTEGLRIR